MSVAGIFLWVITVYFAVGVVIALRFLFSVAPRLDPVFKEASLHVRILFFPGAVAIWPATMLRLKSMNSQTDGVDS